MVKIGALSEQVCIRCGIWGGVLAIVGSTAHCPYLTDEETEALRGIMTSFTSLSLPMPNQGWQPYFLLLALFLHCAIERNGAHHELSSLGSIITSAITRS